MNEELIIKIPSQGSHAHVVMKGSNGLERQKDVSVEDLINNLAANHNFSTGLLPTGTRVFVGTQNSYTIAIETPARKRQLHYRRIRGANEDDMATANIPFPICLFVFKITNNIINSSYLYSIINTIQNQNNRLYYFPFGNVYEDNRICWGSAMLPQINSPMELIGIMNMFFDSVYNGDLFGGEFLNTRDLVDENNRHIGDFWSFVRFMDGKDEFPTNLLNASNRTFRNAIGRD